jgi:hypothetical protein
VHLNNIKKNIKHLINWVLTFFNISFDWLTLNCARHKIVEKSRPLAIFTQTFNEGDLLLYWEAYYGKLVGYENLYILNNAGTDDSCSKLNAKTNLINMPDSINDLHHAMQTQGYFQRFLLLKYKWVLKVDVDEFMVSKENLLEIIDNLPNGIYAPEMAVAVVHDVNTEKSFNYQNLVCEQRGNFVEELDIMKKPSLASTPATWGPGNHSVSEGHKVLNDFWMVHLHSLDLERLVQRNHRFSLMETTRDTDLITKAFSLLKGNDFEFIYNHSRSELASLLEKKRISIPNWIAKKL